MINKLKHKCLDLWRVFIVCMLIPAALPSAVSAIDADDYEDDNSFYQAKLIFVDGDEEKHTLHDANDEDWMFFEGTPGKDYDISLTNLGDTCIPTIEVYVTNQINLPVMPMTSGNISTYSPTYPADGYCYVKVKAIGGSCNGNEYKLKVKSATGPDPDARIAGLVYLKESSPRIPISSNVCIQIKDSNGEPMGGDDNGCYYTLDRFGFFGFYISDRMFETDKTYTVTAQANGYKSYPPSPVTIEKSGQTLVYPIALELNSSRNPKKSFYRDDDGDGFGTNSPIPTEIICIDCTMPAGYVENAEDCDDNNREVTISCRGTTTTTDTPTTTTTTSDPPATTTTSTGEPTTTTTSTTAVPTTTTTTNTVATTTTTNTSEPTTTTTTTTIAVSTTTTTIAAIPSTTITHPPTTTSTTIVLTNFYYDADGDGYGDPNKTTLNTTPPAGYVSNNLDCNDSEKAINPGAVEICNETDDNCNGLVNEGLPLITWYQDKDEDGYGNPFIMTPCCGKPVGYVSDNSDCNDLDKMINPTVAEICNGKDDNCNGQIDEGVLTVFYRDADEDGYGSPKDSIEACEQPEGYVRDNTDCNDLNKYEYPDQMWFKDKDEDGYPDGSPLIIFCLKPEEDYRPFEELTDVTKDCNDNDRAVNPGVEEICCNGKDDNCDGYQEPCLTYCIDADGDGYGSPNDPLQACSAPAGYVEAQLCDDCDDTDPSIHRFTYCKDADGDGYGSPNDPIQACSPPDDYVEAELCNDCDDTNPGINPVSLGNAVSILKILTSWNVECWSDKNGDEKAGLDDVILILRELVK
jgi:hypothetical protein